MTIARYVGFAPVDFTSLITQILMLGIFQRSALMENFSAIGLEMIYGVVAPGDIEERKIS